MSAASPIRRYVFALTLLAGGCSSFQAMQPPTATVDVKEAAELRLGVARMAERNGDLQQARQAYLNLLKDRPHDREVLHRLGTVALKLDQVDEALEYLQRAVSDDSQIDEVPDNQLLGEALGDLAYVQLLKGDLEAAQSTIAAALEKRPTDERLLNNLALILGYAGRTEESLQLFRRVSPEPEALANLALIYSQTDQLEKARELYHQALELDPQLRVAALGLVDLHRLEETK